MPVRGNLLSVLMVSSLSAALFHWTRRSAAVAFVTPRRRQLAVHSVPKRCKPYGLDLTALWPMAWTREEPAHGDVAAPFKVTQQTPNGDDQGHHQDVVGLLFGPALVCKSVQDWLQPNCARYAAMYVPRHYTWDGLQSYVDALAESGAFGRNGAVGQEVDISSFSDSEEGLIADLTRKSQRLAVFAASRGLPGQVAEQIEADFKQIGMVMAKIAPATQMQLKLEIMGENSCNTWHQDFYTARTIISYNLDGTEFVNSENVDFWELKNCGNNDCIIRDSSQVYSAKVGDALFMKGTKFPSAARGLIHRSPPKHYHATGQVMHRLLLKVDLS